MPLLSAVQTPEMNVGAAMTAALLLVAVFAALVFWGEMYRRRRLGRSMLPREPRRRVPWQGIDVVAVLAAYVAFASLAAGIVRVWLRPEVTEPLPPPEGELPDVAHSVLQVLATGNPWVLLLSAVAVVVVAPVVEEFLFRVLLQGWLEAFVARRVPQRSRWARQLPWASAPIFVSSAVFAAAHIRVAGPGYHTDFLVAMLLAKTVADSLLVCFAVAWLKLRVGATGADLGLVPAKFTADVRLGLWSLVGLMGPVYALQIISFRLLPEQIAPDPIPLFFLAIGLGVLYARTHRLAPCVILHAALNAASLALAWFSG